MLDQLTLLVAQTILISVPLVLAALGGVTSERAGVVNIALEGVLLTGAFAAAVAGHASGSAMVGVTTGVLAGVLISALHVGLAVIAGVNQIVSGLAINLLVAGASEYGSKLYWQADADRALPPMPIFRWSSFELLDGTLGRPLVLLTALLVPLMAVLLGRTVLGLRLHAVGESPQACETRGLSVNGLRAIAVLTSGALAGLGGAWLAFNVGQFQHGMSAGKGYIAMAAVVFGRWRPLGATLACLVFGGSEALAASFERWRVPVPSELISTLPYVLTIVAMAGFVGRARPPAALGVAHRRS